MECGVLDIGERGWETHARARRSEPAQGPAVIGRRGEGTAEGSCGGQLQHERYRPPCTQRVARSTTYSTPSALFTPALTPATELLRRLVPPAQPQMHLRYPRAFPRL
jgi:hypothetical protein